MTKPRKKVVTKCQELLGTEKVHREGHKLNTGTEIVSTDKPIKNAVKTHCNTQAPNKLV